MGDGETVNLTITDQNGNTVTATATVDANGEYSVTGVDVSTLTDGPLTIDAAATDNNGDAVTAQDNSAALDATAGDLTVDTVTVDDAAQTVALSGSSTDVGDGETVNLTITDQNGNTVTATATVDANGEYSVTGVDVSTLTDGPLTIDAAATDNNGDAVTAQDNSAALDATAGDLTVDTVTVDDAAQTVALSGSSTDVGDGETVNLTITDQNGNTVTATATVDANGEYSVTGVDVSTLTDGPLTIDAAATDNNGDAVTAQDNSAALDATAGDLTVDTVTVDDAAQTVALSGSSTDVGDGETVNLTITDQNGNTVTATATVDANGEYSVTGVDVSTLTDGPLTIDAAATDNNGDAVTAQDNSAALDATAGDLTVDTVTVDDAAQTVALSGSSTDVGDGETVNLTITDQNGNTVTATATVDANGEYSVTGVDVSTLTDGPLTIDAAATDNNGDAVTAQDNSAALDATAGDLTVDTVTVDDAAQTVALSGSSTDVGDGETVNLTITDQNGNTVTATATVDANGEYSVTGVDVSTLTDGPLTIDAAATDNNGDAVTAQDNSAALDATAGDLTVDTVTVDDAAQTVALSGSSTDVGDGETVNLTITDQNGNTVTATATVDANGEYSVTGVDVSTLTDGPLTIDAAATDNNGDAVTAQDNSAALDATAGDLTVDTVTVDDAAQTVALSGSSTDVGDGETVNLTITDQNGNTVTATATVDANGEYSVTGVDVSTLTDGPLTIDAAATDNNGDAVTAQDNSAALDATAGDLTVDTVTVDDAAQTVALSGSSTDVGDGETVNLTITDQNGNTVTATATVDANGEYSVTGVDVSTLTDGPLTIDAAATDNNGDAVTAQDNSAALDATAGDLTVDTVTVDDAAQTVALSGSSTDVGDGETVNLTITDQNGNTVTATATVDANGEYSVTGVDVSTLTDGPLTIDAAATDNNGDAVTAQDNSAALDATAGDLTVDTVTVDDAAQTVALSGSSTDVGDGETVNLTITDQNGNTVTATATVDANGEYSVTGVDVSTLTDGPLTIDAAATDNNGDAVTAQDNSAALDATAGDLTVDTVTVDDAAQTVALSGSSTDVGDGETVNLTITDQNGNTVTATATVDANGEYSVTGVDVSTLTDGPLTIDAAATDNNGDAVTAQDNSAALDATAGDLTVDTVTHAGHAVLAVGIHGGRGGHGVSVLVGDRQVDGLTVTHVGAATAEGHGLCRVIHGDGVDGQIARGRIQRGAVVLGRDGVAVVVGGSRIDGQRTVGQGAHVHAGHAVLAVGIHGGRGGHGVSVLVGDRQVDGLTVTHVGAATAEGHGLCRVIHGDGVDGQIARGRIQRGAVVLGRDGVAVVVGGSRIDGQRTVGQGAHVHAGHAVLAVGIHGGRGGHGVSVLVGDRQVDGLTVTHVGAATAEGHGLCRVIHGDGVDGQIARGRIQRGAVVLGRDGVAVVVGGSRIDGQRTVGQGAHVHAGHAVLAVGIHGGRGGHGVSVLVGDRQVDGLTVTHVGAATAEGHGLCRVIHGDGVDGQIARGRIQRGAVVLGRDGVAVVVGGSRIDGQRTVGQGAHVHAGHAVLAVGIHGGRGGHGVSVLVGDRQVDGLTVTHVGAATAEGHGLCRVIHGDGVDGQIARGRIQRGAVVLGRDGVAVVVGGSRIDGQRTVGQGAHVHAGHAVLAVGIHGGRGGHGVSVLVGDRQVDGLTVTHVGAATAEGHGLCRVIHGDGVDGQIARGRIQRGAVVLGRDGVAVVVGGSRIDGQRTVGQGAHVHAGHAVLAVGIHGGRGGHGVSVLVGDRQVDGLTVTHVGAATAEGHGLCRVIHGDGVDGQIARGRIQRGAVVLGRDGVAVVVGGSRIDGQRTVGQGAHVHAGHAVLAVGIHGGRGGHGVSVLVGDRQVDGLTVTHVGAATAEGHGLCRVIHGDGVDGQIARGRIQRGAVVLGRDGVAVVVGGSRIDGQRTVGQGAHVHAGHAVLAVGIHGGRGGHGVSVLVGDRQVDGLTVTHVGAATAEGHGLCRVIHGDGVDGQIARGRIQRGAVVLGRDGVAVVVGGSRIDGQRTVGQGAHVHAGHAVLAVGIHGGRGGHGVSVLVGDRQVDGLTVTHVGAATAEGHGLCRVIHGDGVDGQIARGRIQRGAVVLGRDGVAVVVGGSRIDGQRTVGQGAHVHCDRGRSDRRHRHRG